MTSIAASAPKKLVCGYHKRVKCSPNPGISGYGLVYMQVFHTVTHIFRSDMPRLTLYDTTPRDAVAIHGLLFPIPPIDSKGVRVTIS